MTSSGGAGAVPGGWCYVVCQRSSDIIGAELCASAVELTSLLERCDTPAGADTAVCLSPQLSECLTLSVCLLPPVIEASHTQWWCRRISGVVPFVSVASLCRVCRRLSTTKRSSTEPCDVAGSCPRSAVKDIELKNTWGKLYLSHHYRSTSTWRDHLRCIATERLSSCSSSSSSEVAHEDDNDTRAPSHIRRTCVCTLINHCNSCSAVKR